MKTWYIYEGFYIEKMSHSILAMVYEPDDRHILFSADFIDDMIDALKRAKAHFDALECAEAEREKLERWGKARIPTE